MNKITVGIADMKISSDPDSEVVTHSLGSCLGITAYDARAGIGGLLHVMLPVSDKAFHPDKARNRPFMYVDIGVPLFLNSLIEQGAEKRRLEVTVAGGANLQLTKNPDPFFQIGKRNFVMLRKLLWKNNILMKEYDVGGDFPRTMILRIGTGEVLVKAKGSIYEL